MDESGFRLGTVVLNGGSHVVERNTAEDGCQG